MAGNFDILPLNGDDKMILDDMYKTISRLDLWDWLKNINITGEHGIMFSKHAEFDLITKNIEFQGHSGSSFSYTLKMMDFIAKKGWDEYVTALLNTPTCKCKKARKLVGYCYYRGGVPACEY